MAREVRWQTAIARGRRSVLQGTMDEKSLSQSTAALKRKRAECASRVRGLSLTGWHAQVEANPTPFDEVTIDSIAIGAETNEREYDPIVPPHGQVTGKLVFARPLFADIPLVPFGECIFCSSYSCEARRCWLRVRVVPLSVETTELF